MRATTWAFAFVAGAAFAQKPSTYIANPWAVGNPYLAKPLSMPKGSVSPDGTCGGDNEYTCKGSVFGNCCGKDGGCGRTEDYCGAGCQSSFGDCGAAQSYERPTNYPTLASSYEVSPVATGVVTVTDVTKVTTTICEVTTAVTTSGTISNSVYYTTSTIVTTIPYSTVTVTEHPTSYPESSSEVQPTSYPSPSSSSSSSSEAAPTTYPDVTVTSYTTSYVTTCTATESVTSGYSTGLTTYTTLSTVTTVLTSTLTATATATASQYYNTSSPVGTGATGSYTIVSSTPIYRNGSCFTSTVVANGTTTLLTYTTSTTGYATYPTGSGSVVSPTGSYSIVSSTPIYRSDSCFTSTVVENGTTTVVTYTKTGSAYPTGSYPAGNDTSAYQTGPTDYYSNTKTYPSGSYSNTKTYPGGNATSPYQTGPTGTGYYSNTKTYPAGNSTSVGPTGTGTYSHPIGTGTSHITNSANATHSKTSTSTSNTCPTPTGDSDEFCIPCEGQPSHDPNSWCGFTVNDDPYTNVPKTCRTVEYDFVITNTTIAPDGISRLGLLINGQFPGPAIEANWGDTIVVRLTNLMQENGTSLHFHGMRQFLTNQMDGVPSITQCALAPGDSMVYKFIASNYGTSWYHSHWGLQTYDGILGPLIIHGPSSKEYDQDMGAVILQDWQHVSVNEMYDAAETFKPGVSSAPTLDTGLINGKNVWTDNSTGVTTGSRTSFDLIPGQAHMFRVINCAIQASFKLTIDGHKFWVVGMDFVAITPYLTDTLNINIGQRYEIIVIADQAAGNFWMRADNQLACSPITNSADIKAIVHYIDAPLANPTTSAGPNAVQGACVDEPLASLVPVYAMNAGEANDTILKDIVIGAGPNTPNLFKWTLSGTTFQSQWGHPTLQQIVENGTVPDYSGNLAIEVDSLGEWVYLIIESIFPTPHPIHLHGHDFFILSAGQGLYDPSTTVLNLVNPPRRDVANLPAVYPVFGPPGPSVAGHLVIAFKTDNPGAWLVHCHIGWHAEMGFALQIVENLKCIPNLVDAEAKADMDRVCTNWNNYATTNDITVSDSGI